MNISDSELVNKIQKYLDALMIWKNDQVRILSVIPKMSDKEKMALVATLKDHLRQLYSMKKNNLNKIKKENNSIREKNESINNKRELLRLDEKLNAL